MDRGILTSLEGCQASDSDTYRTFRKRLFGRLPLGSALVRHHPSAASESTRPLYSNRGGEDAALEQAHNRAQHSFRLKSGEASTISQTSKSFLSS
jgi:hypothetical protein